MQSRTPYFDRGFGPFGESYNNFGNAAGLDFTGDTQDSFAGLYDTPSRELHPGEGRWLSPDPAGLGSVDSSNPQSWNRYSYVQNNPLNAIDPSGRACFGPQRSLGLCNTAAGFMNNMNFWENLDEFATIPIVPLSGAIWDGPICWNCTYVQVGILQIQGGGFAANNCTPGTAGCYNVPAPPPAACQSVTPADFDYTTPQPYLDPNGNQITQSAQQHITQGHIFPGEPGNTMYATYPPSDANSLFQQVVGYNATTFSYGQGSPQGNGNIAFTYTFPITINQFNNLPAFIGNDPLGPGGGTPLNTNRLILTGNCRLVRTSFPTD
jgi:RHS repeat-associated protein